MAGDNVTFPRYQHFTGRKACALGKTCSHAFGHKYPVQPFSQHHSKFCPISFQKSLQGNQKCFLVRRPPYFFPWLPLRPEPAWLEQRAFSRRRIGRPLIRCFQSLQPRTVQALTQHCFERVFPALLDLNTLPQARQGIEAMFAQPRAQSLAAFEAVL